MSRMLQKRPSKLRCLAGALLLFTLLAERASALDPQKSIFQFNCQTWTRPTGLPDNKISGVVQSRDGYIWLGTQNGLVQFNGLDFKTVPIDLPEAQGHDIRKLVVAKNGGLLFAINLGGFGSYDGEKFSAVGDERLAAVDDAYTILQTQDGSIWTGSSKVGRWVTTNSPGSFFDTQDLGIILSLCEDGLGRVWLGTVERGLFYWVDGRFVQFPDERLKKEIIFALAADAEGQIWVGTGSGLSCYSNGVAKPLPTFETKVNALLVDSHGILWIATDGMGLARYADGKFTYLQKADGLASDYATSLFEDAEGSLWVGMRDGLSQLTDLKFPTYSSKEGLEIGSAHSVAASKNGGLWISGVKGVTYFDGKVLEFYSAGPLLPNRYVKRAYESKNGYLYAVDGDKTLNVIFGGQLQARITNETWPTAFAEDSQSLLLGLGTTNALVRFQAGQLSHYQYTNVASLDYYWINNLWVARDDAIWVASKNGVFRVKDGGYQQWKLEDGLPDLRTQWIFEDTDGSIWSGSPGGISRIKNGRVRTIREKDGLGDDSIFAIVPDDRGFFWVNSGRGIFRVTRQSLNDFADGKLARIQSEMFDGLESVKFNDQTDQEYSGCKTLDGKIWFPNPQGVVMIDPGNFFTNRIAPQVHLQQVIVDGKELEITHAAVLSVRANRVDFFFDALSYIAPRKVQVRYQLEGFDPGWVEAGARRSVAYSKLPPGTYTFRVQAANADGVWNTVGCSFGLELPPTFYQTAWFVGLCVLAGVLLLILGYRWKVRLMRIQQQRLQAQNDLLEVKVGKRTEELAGANTSLQHEIELHKETESQLKQRTQSLETEIEERKQIQLEVERIHKELLQTSRQAGMAEVASNVLHNVGNVLNSVNVSASMVADNAKRSKVASLAKVAELLREHTHDLGTFFINDPRGKQLPDYLAKLSEHFAEQQKAAIKELVSLRGNIDHIKEIVATQQSYAKVSGVKEIINVTDLVEDSLRMNEGALSHHGVEVVREFADVPLINIDKHKVLQILVNLLRNAKHACQDSERADRQLTVRLATGEGRIKISIKDNGVGISPANLTRIFNHGFTTRKDGHGFGLHSGALAAKEMGGTLIAQSDGLGRGATFTLELPVVSEPRAA